MAIYVDDSDPKYEDVEGVLINKVNHTLMVYPACKPGSDFMVPDGVVQLNSNAFKDTRFLKHVILPSSLTTIKESAFVNSSIETIVIPDSVTTLENSAFDKCASLKTAVLGSGVTVMHTTVFRDCTSLEEVTFKGAVTSFETRTFLNCGALRSVDIPDSVTSIGTSCFHG